MRNVVIDLVGSGGLFGGGDSIELAVDVIIADLLYFNRVDVIDKLIEAHKNASTSGRFVLTEVFDWLLREDPPLRKDTKVYGAETFFSRAAFPITTIWDLIPKPYLQR